MPSKAEIALRLKAGRWLAGGSDERGKPAALPVAELVERVPLKENRISQNRIEELEQARIDEPRSMELEKIAAALLLPSNWFSEPDLAKLIPGVEDAPPGQADPSAEKLRRGLEDAARQSDSNDPPTQEQEREAGNG